MPAAEQLECFGGAGVAVGDPVDDEGLDRVAWKVERFVVDLEGPDEGMVEAFVSPYLGPARPGVDASLLDETGWR